jgi:hypothetical protein
MTSILALDLGTTTGVASHNPITGKAWGRSMEWVRHDQEVKEWKKTRLNRRGDPRIHRFHDWLVDSISNRITHIVFEDVEFCSQTYQCQLWTSFRTVVWLAAHKHGCQVEAVPVKSLKLWASGDGGASKKGMMNALVAQARDRFSLVDMKRKTDRWRVKDTLSDYLLDDNAVDALWLYSWGLEHLTL